MNLYNQIPNTPQPAPFRLKPTGAQLKNKELIRPGFFGTLFITNTTTTTNQIRGFVRSYKLYTSPYPGPYSCFIEIKVCSYPAVCRYDYDVTRRTLNPSSLNYGGTYEENLHIKTYKIELKQPPNSPPATTLDLDPFLVTHLDKTIPKVAKLYNIIKHYNIMPDVLIEDFHKPIGGDNEKSQGLNLN